MPKIRVRPLLWWALTQMGMRVASIALLLLDLRGVYTDVPEFRDYIELDIYAFFCTLYFNLKL